MKMKTALYFIFRRHRIFLPVLLVLFFGMQALALVSTKGIRLEQQAVAEKLEQSEDHSKAAIQALASQSAGAYFRNPENQVSEMRLPGNLLHSLQNVETVERLIAFAKTGAGELPNPLPYHYLQQLSFYRSLKAPQIINERALDLYFAMEQLSCTAILCILLAAYVYGMYYETGMERYVRTVRGGRKYEKAMTGILLMTCFVLLICEEAIRLLYSGVLQDGALIRASVQSYTPFCFTQMNQSIGAVLLWMFCGRIFNLLALFLLTKWIAEIRKSVKDTVMISSGCLLGLVFIGKACEDTYYAPFVQFGLVDWKNCIANTVRWGSGICSLYIGSGILAFLLLLMYLLHLRHDRKAYGRKLFCGKNQHVINS